MSFNYLENKDPDKRFNIAPKKLFEHAEMFYSWERVRWLHKFYRWLTGVQYTLPYQAFKNCVPKVYGKQHMKTGKVVECKLLNWFYKKFVWAYSLKEAEENGWVSWSPYAEY
jgi:hypothetical protein